VADSDDAGDAIRRLHRRRWGIAALCANAQLLLDRLAHGGRGAAVADDRRHASRRLHAARLQQSIEWARRGLRIWRTRRPYASEITLSDPSPP